MADASVAQDSPTLQPFSKRVVELGGQQAQETPPGSPVRTMVHVDSQTLIHEKMNQGKQQTLYKKDHPDHFHKKLFAKRVVELGGQRSQETPPGSPVRTMVHVDSRELIHEKMDQGDQQTLDQNDQPDHYFIGLKR